MNDNDTLGYTTYIILYPPIVSNDLELTDKRRIPINHAIQSKGIVPSNGPQYSSTLKTFFHENIHGHSKNLRYPGGQLHPRHGSTFTSLQPAKYVFG